MSRPFSLYLTVEAPSVALLVLNPSVLVRIQVLFLQNGTFKGFPCQPPLSFLHRLHLWICDPGGFGARGAGTCPLHGTLLWAWDFLVGKQSGEVQGPVLFQVTLSQTCKNWGMENTLGQSKAGGNCALWEQWPLWYSSGRVELLPLSACHGENGLDESLADFLMTSMVSTRCAKNISCNGDLLNRFFISSMFDSCSKIKSLIPPVYVFCCLCMSKDSALIHIGKSQSVWCLYIY